MERIVWVVLPQHLYSIAHQMNAPIVLQDNNGIQLQELAKKFNLMLLTHLVMAVSLALALNHLAPMMLFVPQAILS